MSNGQFSRADGLQRKKAHYPFVKIFLFFFLGNKYRILQAQITVVPLCTSPHFSTDLQNVITIFKKMFFVLPTFIIYIKPSVIRDRARAGVASHFGLGMIISKNIHQYGLRPAALPVAELSHFSVPSLMEAADLVFFTPSIYQFRCHRQVRSKLILLEIFFIMLDVVCIIDFLCNFNTLFQGWSASKMFIGYRKKWFCLMKILVVGFIETQFLILFFYKYFVNVLNGMNHNQHLSTVGFWNWFFNRVCAMFVVEYWI